MKKVLQSLLMLTVVVAACFFLNPAKANAAGIEDLTFTLNSDGTGYCITHCDTSAAGALTIPATYNAKPVTAIGENVFEECSQLTSVAIPDSVSIIGSVVLEPKASSVKADANTARLAGEFVYYGRQQLATMRNAAALLYAYDQIVAGVANGAKTISIYNGVNAITKDEMMMVMDVYRRDYAHHFWIGNNYSYSYNSKTCISIVMTYTVTGSQLQAAKEDFNRVVDDILSGIAEDMSEYERELYLHNTLAGMITYADTTHAHNAYGALVEGKAVCEGYAEAFQYLLHRVGIQSFLAIGEGIDSATGETERHEWNYVRIDGKYYHVDLTWNDQGEQLFHAYFNQTDWVMQEDHSIDATAYTLPSCNSTEAQYFYGKDTYLDTYNIDIVGQLMKNNGLSAQVYIPGDVDSFIKWYKENISFIAASAGVKIGFSYSIGWLGREVILNIKVSCSHSALTVIPGRNATCTQDGLTEGQQCSRCGMFIEVQTVIPAEGHSWGWGSVIRAATCKEAGIMSYTCDVCGETRTEAIAKSTVHTYTNDKDTSCNVCGTVGYPGGNTLVKENGIWYHIVDRQKVKDTTLVYYGGYWFYIKDGKINYSNTLCKWNGKWYHVKNGQVVYDTTLVYYGGYWFYVKSGVVDFNATTLCYFGSAWYYVKNGQVNYSNTLCNWNGKWWHVSGGKVVYDTTLVYFAGSWYYVKSGVLNYSNTLCNWNGIWWHVSGGKVAYDTTLVYFAGSWYYVKSGELNYSNTLCNWNGKWWHVKNGAVVKDTTLVYFAGDWYYVKNGVVDFSYSGRVLFSGSYYTVKNGVKV